MAARALSSLPSAYAEPTISGSPSVIPKPVRNPLWRSSPTEMPGARSSIAILGSMPSSSAFAFA